MRICIDSNQFIFGITGTDSASERLLLFLPDLDVFVPRLVMIEVTRNLRSSDVATLYTLLNRTSRFRIIEEPAPRSLVLKYVDRGCVKKGMPLLAHLPSGSRWIT